MRWSFFILLLSISSGCFGQLSYETVWVDYDSAWEYKSLRLIPVRQKRGSPKPLPPVVSFNRALAQGIISVSERGSASTEDVHWLKIRNQSDKTIYVASGQTLIGGRQDRIITKDTLLEPNGKDQFINVMCIEEGRWSEKEKKFNYGNYANSQLRQVLDKTKNQMLVWKEIYAQLDSAHFSSPTLAFHALRQQKDYQATELDYLNYFRKRMKSSDSSMIGIVCVTGNRILGTDIFAFHDMFYDELEALMHGYIADAVLYGAAPVASKEKIKEFMDEILTSQEQQNEYCRKNGKIFRAQGRVVHVTAYPPR